MNPEPELACGRQPAASPAKAETLNRRQLLAWTLFGLIPASVVIALLVLHFMAASAAAATGGCGGG
jgi:ABC-type nickel/cobalt efflux system permease component RcnA